jgi:hypothetical protein
MAGAKKEKKKRRERGKQSFFVGVSKPKLRWAARLTLVLLRQELEKCVFLVKLPPFVCLCCKLIFSRRDVVLVQMRFGQHKG